MQKLAHQQSGNLGELLALGKLTTLGLHAYMSPDGAPGHDLMVITTEGPKSVEVKTRQYIDKPTEITRWPVEMETQGDADFFLFVELNLMTLTPTFYLLSNAQACSIHKVYGRDKLGSCPPPAVRKMITANDFTPFTRV